MPKGWRFESERHALASRGIETKTNKVDMNAQGIKRDLRMELNDWLDNVNACLDDDSNLNTCGPFKDEWFVIYYKDGTKKRLHTQDYEGEKVRKQHIRNIFSGGHFGARDYSGQVEADDDYFAEQEKIQEKIKEGKHEYLDKVRLGEEHMEGDIDAS